MRIQPDAHNAIEVTLDDGTTFRLHDTVHGDKSYLFINIASRNNVLVESMKHGSLDWTPDTTQHMIRISDGGK